MATYHYYGYWPFSVNIAGNTTFDGATVEEAKNAIDIMHSNFIENGIGVICGEYGVLGTIDHAEYLKYLEYITSYGHKDGIAMMLWDTGGSINRHNYTWDDQSTHDIIMSSANSLRSSYAASDRIFVSDKDRNSDFSTRLTLNGNKLFSISDENRKLIIGKDYTYDNETVTFKGSYINSIVNDKYGINQTLIMKFTNGADWKVDVTHNKKPVASDVKGTKDKLVIPMNFNGSILSTMEATYANGSGAGPNNWTTYKEFGYTFSPNYDNNTIEIKDKFFAECNDGEIHLKFHWKNGDITQYVLNKSGKVVNGTALESADLVAPSNLTCSTKTTNSVSLSWAESTDNVGVIKYDIYNGSTLVGTSLEPYFTVTGLSSNTTYSFNVKAEDSARNISPPSSPLSVTTGSESKVLLGDVNCNGEIDMIDYMELQKCILLGESSSINKQNADINKDGKINTADLFALRKTILNS